jgi:hypothetical protein
MILAHAGVRGGWGRPRGAKGFFQDIPVHLLSVNKKEVLTITYLDCWPTNLAQLPLISDASTALQFEVEFATSDVKWEVSRPSDAIDALFDKVKAKAFKAVGLDKIPSPLRNLF